jgi:hypothetical protein
MLLSQVAGPSAAAEAWGRQLWALPFMERVAAFNRFFSQAVPDQLARLRLGCGHKDTLPLKE